MMSRSVVEPRMNAGNKMSPVCFHEYTVKGIRSRVLWIRERKNVKHNVDVENLVFNESRHSNHSECGRPLLIRNYGKLI